MKNWISLLLIALLPLGLCAQVTPVPAPADAPAPSAATPQETEAMRLLLRSAVTNATRATNIAAPVQPTAAAPAGGIPAPGAQIPPPSGIPVVPRRSAPNLAPGTSPAATAPATAVVPPNVIVPAVPNPAVAPPGVNVIGQIAPGQTAGGAAVALGPDVDPDEIIPADLVQLSNMPLEQFLYDVYQEYSGRTVLRGAAVQIPAQGGVGITLRITKPMARSKVVFGMDAVLAQNGFAMVPVGELFVKVVPIQNAVLEPAKIGKGSGDQYADSEEFVNHIAELKAIKPSDMVQLLQGFSKVPNGLTPIDSNNTLVIRDFAGNVKRMLEVIEKTDVAHDPEYILEVIPIKYGRVEEFYETMNALVQGGGGGGGLTGGATGVGQTAGLRNAGGAGLGGNTRTARTGLGSNRNNTSGYGAQNYNNSGGGIRPQQVAPPTGVGGAQTTFNSNLQRALNTLRGGQEEEVEVLDKNVRIVADPRANSLLIFAHRRDMAMITNIVSKLDKLLAQVLIEAVVFEVQLGDSINLGVSILQNPKQFGQDFTGAGLSNNGQFLSSLTNFPGNLPGGLHYFGQIGPDLDVALRAIAENSSVNVVSRPRIQTSHGIPGNFFVGQNVPTITGTTDYYGGINTGANNYNRSTVQRLDVGFTLDVIPFITPEGYVVMDIIQSFSSLGRDVIIDGNPNPIINDRNANATLTVRDGQTIMMGGFITESKSKAKSGVPILKSIPGLGFLFRSKNDKNDRSELVVMMRAKVLHTPEEAALVAAQERQDLFGIQQAEKDFQKDEEKRRSQQKKEKKP